jgi:hypothetical protein
MDTVDLNQAKKALREREGISEQNKTEPIGVWSRGIDTPHLVAELPQWAESRGIDAVVWTALPRSFNGKKDPMATVEQVVLYLGGLTGRARDNAESHVRRAPKQIDTPYRRKIEAALQWTPFAPGL